MADFDLSGILNSLSGEDMENLKKMAEGLFGGNQGQSGGQNSASNAEQFYKPPQNGQNANPNYRNLNLNNMNFPDFSVIEKLAPVIGAFAEHDERSDFIMALKPLLSEERRKKADEAIKLIKLISVLPVLKEQGIM